ncbi:hypothetical protein [Antrihabitans spumae]|uniref:Uncharacterized protein n=1 Tax=Antrihabitans spumae TaxID=3373370 RepID=A0ABW7KUD6_9NOCA
MNNNSVLLDFAPLAQVRQDISRLREGGWDISDGIRSVTATLAPAANPEAALNQLVALQPAALNVEVTGSRAGSSIVIRLVNTIPEITETKIAEPRSVFDQRIDQDNAYKAIEGDAQAALKLPMEWSVRATFVFSTLVDLPDLVSLSVSMYSTTVTQHILAINSINIHTLLNNDNFTIFAALDTPETAHLGMVALAGVPESLGISEPIRVTPATALAGESSDGPLPPPGALLRDARVPAPAIWEVAAVHLKTLAAELVWRTLATSESIDGNKVVLTFVGYKKSSFAIPATGAWDSQHVNDTLALRQWALHDPSPDRLLAVRQVTSLYDGGASPFNYAKDIQASAEIIYVGLRSDAVAEAVKSSREAHAQAQEAARQTVKNATEMLKGATERVLATLIAVGAVLMANAGRVLPDNIGRLLIILVAIFLSLLAVASIVVEGPLLALPANKLKPDLVHQAGLLTDDQRNGIDLLPSLEAARCRIKIVRWCVPSAYIAFAVLLVAFGHPGQYN